MLGRAPGNTGRSRSAEKDVGVEAREGPNTQDRAERLMSVTTSSRTRWPPLIHLALLTVLLQQRNRFA